MENKNQEMDKQVQDNNQIIFNIRNGQVKVSFHHKISIEDFMQVIFTGTLSAMQSVTNMAPEEQRMEVKEDLYDMLNAAASNTLQYFAPEIEMRPHLSTQAILEAENAIINRKYDKLKAVKKGAPDNK